MSKSTNLNSEIKMLRRLGSQDLLSPTAIKTIRSVCDVAELQDEVCNQALRIFLLFQIGSDMAIAIPDLRKSLQKAGYWKSKNSKQKDG